MKKRECGPFPDTCAHGQHPCPLTSVWLSQEPLRPSSLESWGLPVAEVRGQSDDSKHLAARVLPVPQTKQRRVRVHPPPHPLSSSIQARQIKRPGPSLLLWKHWQGRRMTWKITHHFHPRDFWPGNVASPWWRESLFCFPMLDSHLRPISPPTLCFLSSLPQTESMSACIQAICNIQFLEK